MKTRINGKFFKKFFLTGILSLAVIVAVMGQTSVAQHSLEAHQNNRCSSGRVYVIRIYGNGSLIMTSYYCENEISEFNSVYNALAGKNPNLILKTDVIDNSSNQPSPAEIEAERQKQTEIEQQKVERQREADRQRQIERVKQQQEFEQNNKELIANLKGAGLENTNELSLKGMRQTSTINGLELKGVNSSNDKAVVTVSPDQWTMTPDQLDRELKMSRTAYELAMQQINNFEKNKNVLQQEIMQLTTKNKNDEKLVYDYEKHIAILEYKRRLVALYGFNDKSSNDWRKEQEDLLQQKYAITASEIESYKSEVNTVCGKIDYNMDADPDAENKYIKTGSKIAKGTIELSYSNPKNEAIENLSKLKEKMNSNASLIESKKEQSDGLTVKYERLQKVFQKYGNDILESKDDAKIIQFGNECRNALNIKIEEQY